MKMRFAVGMGRNERIDEIGDHARVAEESGFSALTFIDSQNLSRDIYCMMTIAALNTHHIRIGHGVTVPFTRHPSITANATATINEVSGGRAFVGIGAGGSAGWTMGTKTRPLRDLREAVLFIKKYTAGEEVEFQGARMHSEWIRAPVPVYMGARGPKSLQQAGEIADGVFFSGAHPEVVRWAMEQVEKGALKAGRDPSKIDFWARCMIYVNGSKDASQREASSYAAHVARLYSILQLKDPDAADLRRRIERAEPGIVDEFKRAHDAWDHYQHERTDASHGKAVTQRVNNFVNLTGKPDDICERINRLGQLGVKTVSTVVYTIIDKKGMMREIGDKIIPHFRS